MHTAIFDAIAARIRERGASRVLLRRDPRVDLQRNLYLEIDPDWSNATKEDAAVAQFLGDFLLDESPEHPYADIVAYALRAHRFSFAIPMASIPAG